MNKLNDLYFQCDECKETSYNAFISSGNELCRKCHNTWMTNRIPNNSGLYKVVYKYHGFSGSLVRFDSRTKRPYAITSGGIYNSNWHDWYRSSQGSIITFSTEEGALKKAKELNDRVSKTKNLIK